MKTCTQYKKQAAVTKRAFDTYFLNKNEENMERWKTAPGSEVCVLKPDRFYVI